MSVRQKKAMKKIVEDVEDAKLIEPTHSYWASIFVRKKMAATDYMQINEV